MTTPAGRGDETGTSATLNLLEVTGSGFERGRQHAMQAAPLRPALMSAIEARLAGLPPSTEPWAAEALGEWRAAVAREAPDFAAEVEGLAAGFDLDPETFWRYTAAGYLSDRSAIRRLTDGHEGCSVVAVKLRDRGPVLAKNRDYFGTHRGLQAVGRIRPAGGHRHIVITSVGSPGAFSSGMNEAGLAIADAHVLTADLGPGLPSNALMSAVLERCVSVPEAIDFVRGSARAGGCNLVVADAAGRAAVIEVGHTAVTVRGARSACAATNHFRGGRMRFLDGQGIEDTTESRYNAIDRELPGLDCLADLSALLARHDVGPMCQHRADGGGTISSAVYVLRERKLLVTPGPPCRSTPEEVSL